MTTRPATSVHPGPDFSELPDLPGAACARPGADPEWWFPEPATGRYADPAAATVDAAHARYWCHHCPVRNPCLTYALDHHPLPGIWAGTSLQQRTAIRARRAAEAAS